MAIDEAPSQEPGLTLLDPTPANQAPTANPGGPYSATAGTPVKLDGSGSTDPDGTIASYAWNFGNGSSGSGVSPSVTYASAGTFTVTLTVTDNGGSTSSPATTSVTVSVGLQPPVASAGGPYAGSIGVPIGFDGAASQDPDGSIVSYAWNFGDGGTGSGSNPTHSYAVGGMFTVTLGRHKSPDLTLIPDPEPAAARLPDQGHQINFAEAVRTRNRDSLNAEIRETAISTALCHLGNIAYRIGEELEFDPATGRFANNEKANALLTRDYRAPYIVPKVV